MNRAVFLDRDGTLIHECEDPANLGDPGHVRLVQGAAAAVASLHGLGYKIIVVTNQGGVARGQYDEADVEAVHQRINDLVHDKSGASIDRFYYCPYHPEGTVQKYATDHPWRKPQPGMLFQASQDLELSLSKCWMIGDHVRDVQAGRAAGARTILLTDSLESEGNDQAADFLTPSLVEAVRVVGQQRRPESELERHVPSTSASDTAEDAKPPTPIIGSKESSMSMAASTARVESPSDIGPSSPTTQPDEPALPPADHTLRQILHELRNQRSAGGEFTYVTIMAIVLQMVAAVCLLAAIFMGRADPQTFLSWMLAALLFQLATIAMLLFRR